MIYGLVLALVLAQPSGTADVVVTALPPVNAERLADVLRTYLTEFGIRVETAQVTSDDDLRGRLVEARRAGEAHRAVAVVRAEHGSPGRIEIELVDLATDKALITSVPRPLREADLYRALALKIQALLRSTLSEADPGTLAKSPVGRLIAQTPSGSAMEEVEEEARQRSPALFSIAVGYAGLSFPVAGSSLDPAMQGLSIAGLLTLRPWLDLMLEGAALGAARGQSGDVFAVASLVPITAALRLRRAGARFTILAGPNAELAVVSVATSSTVTPVHSTRDLMAALGGEVEGQARLAAAFWLYVRGSALGVLLGQRYVVEGRPILDTSRFQVTLAAGVGIDLR